MTYQDTFVDTKEFRSLSRDSQVLSLYLLLGKVSLCGVAEFDEEMITFVLKMNESDLKKSLNELEGQKIIVFDRESDEIVFPNFIKGENPLKFSRSKAVKFRNDLLRVKSEAIKKGIENNYSKLVHAAKVSDTAGNQAGTPLKNLDN